MKNMLPSRRALALRELVAAAAIVGVGLCLAAPIAGRTRAHAQVSGSLANLREIAGLTASFSADRAGTMPAFTWVQGQNQTPFNDLRFASTDLVAGANQAVDIIRRRSAMTSFPVQGAWIPHIQYSMLTLADHAGLPLPAPLFASPSDTQLLGWQRTLTGPDSQPGNQRLVFSSSYEYSTAFYYSGEVFNGQLRNSGAHNLFTYSSPTGGPGLLVARHTADVRFPSLKAMLFERASLASGPNAIYFMYAQARIPILMGDHSAAVRSVGDSDRGAYTTPNGNRQFAQFNYQPMAWEPQISSGMGTLLEGRLRWTHRLLQGRDFGPAIP